MNLLLENYALNNEADKFWEDQKMRAEEYKRYLDMMNQWLILEQEGKRIDRFIKKQGWIKVAVYGMAIYGRHIIRDLKSSDCAVVYAVDQKKMDDYDGVKVWRPRDPLPQADVLINSVIHEHSKIVEEMSDIILCPIVNLEDVVFESY